MAKNYEKELRYYVASVKVDVFTGKPCFLSDNGCEVTAFIDAKHFNSIQEASDFIKRYWKSRGDFIIRSLFVEINRFDIGEIV